MAHGWQVWPVSATHLPISTNNFSFFLDLGGEHIVGSSHAGMKTPSGNKQLHHKQKSLHLTPLLFKT